MIDAALLTDLAEILGRSLTFNDVEVVGGQMFRGYNTHKLESISPGMSISPLNAARRLVTECEDAGKTLDLVAMVVQLDGSFLNGRVVEIVSLENFLYKLSLSGLYFDFQKRKLLRVDTDKKQMANWGALKDGKEYPIVVASVDICGNSKLVKKHSPKVMERVYYELWDYLRHKLELYDGRIWSWAGDGGILAFRYRKDTSEAVRCCLETLLALPVFNLSARPIKDDIVLRIGLDAGTVKFASDTGRIVSDVVNYAAHLEKKGTAPSGLSVSDSVYGGLPAPLKKLFTEKKEFEGRTAYSLIYDFSAAVA